MSSRDNTLFRAQIVLTLLYPTRHLGTTSAPEQWHVLIDRCLDWWELVGTCLQKPEMVTDNNVRQTTASAGTTASLHCSHGWPSINP